MTQSDKTFTDWLDDQIRQLEEQLRAQTPDNKPVKTEPKPVTRPIAPKPQSDPVNHPAHYTSGGIEVIDFIEAKGLNYNLGNVVKYVSRCGKKDDALEDLKKAAWYLDREIKTREKAQ